MKAIAEHLRKSKNILLASHVEPDGDALYYQEKKDFFNVDYNEDYEPDFEEMQFLLETPGPLQFEYDEERKTVTVTYLGSEYEFAPWSQGNLP